MEGNVMSLPGYSRGLKLVRLGVFVILAQQAIGLFVIARSIAGGSDLDGALETIKWLKYGMWAGVAGTGLCFLGSVLPIPDFRRSRMSLGLVIVSIVGLGVAAATMWWGYDVFSTFLNLMDHIHDVELEELEAATERLANLQWATIAKDFGYVLGLIAVVRAIRQTAVANDHFELRDASSQITGLLVVLLIGDTFFQLTYGLGASGVTFALIGMLFGIGLLIYWVYCQLRLAKFLKAAAYLMNEPHNLPAAQIVSAPETAPEKVAPKPRVSAPRISRPNLDAPPSTPSQPVIVVQPELRTAPAPRADTQPGDPDAPKPKFLT